MAPAGFSRLLGSHALSRIVLIRHELERPDIGKAERRHWERTRDLLADKHDQKEKTAVSAIRHVCMWLREMSGVGNGVSADDYAKKKTVIVAHVAAAAVMWSILHCRWVCRCLCDEKAKKPTTGSKQQFFKNLKTTFEAQRTNLETLRENNTTLFHHRIWLVISKDPDCFFFFFPPTPAVSLCRGCVLSSLCCCRCRCSHRWQEPTMSRLTGPMSLPSRNSLQPCRLALCNYVESSLPPMAGPLCWQEKKESQIMFCFDIALF